jgi:hypothetical protein
LPWSRSSSTRRSRSRPVRPQAVGHDADVWAREIAGSKRRLKKPAPDAVNLANAITGISMTDTIRGASSVTITIIDQGWKLLDSGFFDADKDGKLDPIEVNYPQGSSYWWRFTQMDLDLLGDGVRLDLIFMERLAALAMNHRGPLKTSRAKKTRAQFIKGLFDRIKKYGGAEFHSKQLRKAQPLEPQNAQQRKSERQRKANKEGGIDPNDDLEIDGVPATRQQLRQVERAMDVAAELNPSELAVLAMLVAGIGESGFKAIMNRGGSPYGGVFQGNVRGGVFKVDDTEGMAYHFMKGGKGFQGGGAIALAKANPRMKPGEIALTVEGSVSNFPNRQEAILHYQRHIEEAEALYASYGGGVFNTEIYRKQYNFEVGTLEDPDETYWDAANRLAKEVNWPLFIDGRHVYYDAETTLIRQKPAAILKRGDPAIVDLKATWDDRGIATEMTLELICDPFKFRAGETFKFVGFGPISTGSTLKKNPLPGRWLIEEWDRSRDELTTTFTLKQPEKPYLEPRTETVERSLDDETFSIGGPITGDSTPKEIIDEIVLPIAQACGVNRTVEANDAGNASRAGTDSDHGGPPSVRWAADMSNGFAPTEEMDKLAEALWERFDMPKLNLKTSFAKGSMQDSRKTIRRGDATYNLQLIYRSGLGGNHDNHVHFGVNRSGPSPRGRIPGVRPDQELGADHPFAD